MFQPEDFGRVGVLMGGMSSERAISLRSGQAVHEALRQKGIDALSLDLQGTRAEIRVKICEAQIELAFIALHGHGGEDGFIQNLLDELEIPFIGSTQEGSQKAFNKLRAKEIFSENEILTPAYVTVSKTDWQAKTAGVRFPVFVKPIEEGSSIGVQKVENLRDFSIVIPEALKEYDSLLVEEAIEGRELTVGILGEQALPVIELKPKRKFYDYTAKYTKGMTEYLVPAPIASGLSSSLQEMALKAHRILGLRDFSRVDVMLDRNHRPFILEVNTIPGFTETSLLPKAARQAGIEFGDLCLALLNFAKERCCWNGKKK